MSRGKRVGPYRSRFEAKFQSNFPNLEFETQKFKYTWPAKTATYTPDFKVTDKIFIETKGRFELKDREKLLLMKEQHPDIQVVLVFQNPKLVLGKRLGTVTDWANKHKFTCFAGDDIKGLSSWISERI